LRAAMMSSSIRLIARSASPLGSGSLFESPSISSALVMGLYYTAPPAARLYVPAGRSGVRRFYISVLLVRGPPPRGPRCREIRGPPRLVTVRRVRLVVVGLPKNIQSVPRRPPLEEFVRIVQYQGVPQPLVDVVGLHQLHPLENLRRDLDDVLGVLLGNHHGLDAATMGRQDLFLETANREHAAAQRDLARHRQIVADGLARKSGDQCSCQSNAGGRPVLGDRPLRDMNVNIDLVVEKWVQSENVGARAHVRQRSLRAFLHYLTELAGDGQLAAAGDYSHL